MSGRVLNFFEFSDKYSTENNDSSGIDNISNAAANFEEGFDDSTYDQPQLGPKRPVSGNYEATPAVPGEGEVAAFSPGAKSGMEVPEEDEMKEEIENDESEDEIEEEDDDSGNPEGDEEDDESEEKVEESFRLVKSFSKFVNESYDDYDGEDAGDLEAYLGDDYADEEGDWEEEGEDFGYFGANPEDYFGYGANPDGEEITDQVENAVAELSDEEKEILANYLEMDPEAFQEMVEDELEQQSEYGANPRRDLGMGREEFQTRKIIDKIIKKVAIGSALAIVPAAMFISGGVALALGITALGGTMGKDLAWSGRKGHNYDAQDWAESGRDYPEENEDQYGMYPEEDGDYEDEGDEMFCSSCGAAGDEYGYSCGCNM